MKKTLLLIASTFMSIQLFCQAGLENIIVEKYYISDANDATQNDVGGILPVGSVTYRVYVDMLPDYKFQAVYGVPDPAHELRIATTTTFFNNEDRGAISPTYTKTSAKNNTVMLDSWISVGAACSGNFGILKSEDDGVATNTNNDGLLINTNVAAGIPLTQEDGLIAGSPQPVTILGIDALLAMFDNTNGVVNGEVFSTFDGAWSALNGATGPNPATNKVLIGQFTTDGVFSFELNVQIGTPSGGVENYVASNPVGAELLFEGLTYTSDIVSKTHYLTSETESFTVYPNPSQEVISVESSEIKDASSRYSIYNMRGQLVSVKTTSGFNSNSVEQFNISNFPKGQYLIELVVNGKRSVQKFTKN
jgi:hypothetical protein